MRTTSSKSDQKRFDKVEKELHGSKEGKGRMATSPSQNPHESRCAGETDEFGKMV